jgi:hypothetical protein
MASADNNRNSGFNTTAVVLCGLAAVIFVYAMSLFIEGGYNAALNKEMQTKIYSAPLSEEAIAQRAEQQALLDELPRYLDPEAGVLCIPVEDAMERIVVKNAN